MKRCVKPMPIQDPPVAEQTMCGREVNGGRCHGTLMRTNDGADRLAELSGRIVVRCDRCHTTWSIPVVQNQI